MCYINKCLINGMISNLTITMTSYINKHAANAAGTCPRAKGRKPPKHIYNCCFLVAKFSIALWLSVCLLFRL